MSPGMLSNLENSMKFTHLLVVVLIAIVLMPFAAFSAGIIDQTFATNGTLNLNFGNQTNIVDVEAKSDGKIVVAGTIANSTSGKDIVVAQFNANGTRDTNFGTNGVTISVTSLDETISDLEIGADGKLVVVGQRQAYDGVNGVFDFLVVRYDAVGLLDSTFGNTGFVAINQSQADIFHKVAIQPDGKIVAVGNTFETSKEWWIVRLASNGLLDPGFANGGISTANLNTNPGVTIVTDFRDVEVLSDGRIVSGYGIKFVRPGDDEVGFGIRVLAADGSPNTTIANNLRKQNLGFNGLEFDSEVLPNGNIAVVAGNGVYLLNQLNFATTRAFSQNGISVAKFNDGRFVVSGGQYRGTLRTYSSTAFIGSAWNLPAGKLSTSVGGKILSLSNNVITSTRNLTSQATRTADFDNDGKSDIIVDRPSANVIYLLKGNGGYISHNTQRIGSKKIIPEYSEFFPGLGGAFRNNVLYFWSTGNFREEWLGSTGGPTTAVSAGISDIPIGGDYDGDGNSDYARFTSNGDWIHQNGPFATTTSFFHWGTTGDKPVPADYDNDGITDYAVYRPSTGIWWIHRSSNDSSFGLQFGLPTDIPLTGDYDADGKADLAVYRPSNGFWYLLMTTDGFKAVQFGLATDIPVPGDYDGDGKHDIAVFRNGIWYLLQSRDGFTAIQWGQAGDVPVTVRYDN
jgi:uncharacterized delta-60 repeat protein